MMSMPNMIIVIAIATMVALCTLVSNAYRARIQQPAPWAALIKQAVKGFISGIFIRILQCFDDLINPSGLDENVISESIALHAVPGSQKGQSQHACSDDERQEGDHLTRLAMSKARMSNMSMYRLPCLVMTTARACLRHSGVSGLEIVKTSFTYSVLL